MGWCNVTLTDILRLICALLKMFKEELTAASWILEPLGGVGRDVPEYFSSG